MLKTVRMLADHPPGAEGPEVRWPAGSTREVDPERAAHLLEHGLAEEVLETPAAEAPAPSETAAAPPAGETAAPRRRSRKGA